MSMDISVGNVITIVTTLVAMGVGWGVLQQQIKEHAKRLDRHDVRVHEVDECLLSIKVQLAGIARDIMYIREQIDRDSR